MRFKLLCLIPAITVGAAVGSPAQAAESAREPIRLAPSSKWNADYAEKKCRLARVFGEGDEQHVLFFEQGGPDNRFGFSVAGPELKRFNRPSKITIEFGSLGPSQDVRPMVGDLETVGHALIYPGLGLTNEPRSDNEESETRILSSVLIDTDLAGEAESVTIRQGKRSIVFETGNLAAPMKVLNHCSVDLVRAWGLDPEKHRDMLRMPIWQNQEAVTKRIVDRYPSRALRRGEQGVIRMRAIVDAGGNVTSCEMVEATRTSALESPACREMRGARFDPALDAQGNPMPSYHLATIVYRIGPNISRRNPSSAQ